MSWHLLRSREDWTEYQRQFTIKHQLERCAVVWGQGPTSFPCLVDGFSPAPTKVITAYVYPDDARQLLPVAEFGPSHPAVRAQAQAQSAVAERAPDHWRDFSASTSAHILAIVDYMTETGICTKEKYEEKYNTILAQVDQWSTEDRNARLARITQPPGE